MSFTTDTPIPAADLTTVCLKNVTWTEGSQTVHVANDRLFGVADAEGRMFSTDGVSPAAWGAKRTAEMVKADGLLAGTTWITVNNVSR
jgi:hypothetical protein